MDIKNLSTDKSPFTPRKPKLRLWHLALLGILIAATLFFAHYYASVAIRNTIVIIISLAITLLIYLVQHRGFDEKTASEFQSLIFSGSMRSNTLVTLILYRDGSVFYLDPRYAMNFPNAKASHNFDQFLTTIGLSDKDKIYIYESMRQGGKSEFEYNFRAGGITTPLKIGIYPIQRPEGFLNFSVMEK